MLSFLWICVRFCQSGGNGDDGEMERLRRPGEGLGLEKKWPNMEGEHGIPIWIMIIWDASLIRIQWLRPPLLLLLGGGASYLMMMIFNPFLVEKQQFSHHSFQLFKQLFLSQFTPLEIRSRVPNWHFIVVFHITSTNGTMILVDLGTIPSDENLEPSTAIFQESRWWTLLAASRAKAGEAVQSIRRLVGSPDVWIW